MREGSSSQMFSNPSDMSQRQREIDKAFWAKVVEHEPAIVYRIPNWRGPREHGDQQDVFIPTLPYNPLSQVAQQTGKFSSSPNEMVDLDSTTNSVIISNWPLCGACHNALLYFRSFQQPEAEDSGRGKEELKKEETSEASEEETHETGGEYVIENSTREEGIDEKKSNRKSLPKAVLHHEDLVSFSASVKVGCSLCKELNRHVALLDANSRPEDIRLEICWDQRSDEIPRSTLYFIFTRIGDDRNWYNYANYYLMHAYPHENYTASFHSPISGIQNHGHTTGSLMCRSLAQHWFNNCNHSQDEKHIQCHVLYPDFLPDRLLDAEGARTSGILRVVEQGEMPRKYEDYITLSYVWGPKGPKHLPLLKSTNLENRRDVGIPVTELPKTFRDAIEVTGWFNVKWLWIDCMCILQDSTTDWQRETESMSLIYRNAMLNISADAASNAQGGCFAERDPAKLKVWQLKSGKREWYIRPHHEYERNEAQSTASYWRVWIYRERQLSRRILHFTPKELIWECCGIGLASETYPGGAPFEGFDATFGGQAKHQWLSRDGTIHDQGMSREALRESWDILCDSFSARQLTKRTDMPIIISTLAADFEYRLPGDTYMSGHWASQMPHCLLWTTKTVRPGNLPTRPEDAMATTWSWLWKGNAVEMRGLWNQLPVLQIANMGVMTTLPTTHSRRVFMLGCKGIMRKIRVTLAQRVNEEQLRKGNFLEKVDLIDKEKRSLGMSQNPKDGNLCDFTYDSHIEGMTRDYHCLFVNMDRVRGSPSINALLLKPLDDTKKDENSFRRVGTVTFRDLMALKMRYRVRSPHRSSEQRQEHELQWEKLESAFAETDEHCPTKEDMEVPSREIDPSWVYRYDTKGDFSWLDRLDPQEIELY